MPKKTKAHLSARNKPSLKRTAPRKRTTSAPEEPLRQSEERFAAFMDNLPGYAWMKDLQGRYVYVNHRVKGLPGYKSLGKTDAQIWPADLAAEYRANDEQVIAAKKPLHTLEHYVLDGKQRYMLGSKFPIFDKTGAVALVAGTGVDITEYIEAEEALRENQQLLQLVLATLPVGVSVTDRDGNILLTNAASKRIWSDTIVSGRERRAQSKGSWHDSGKRIAPTEWASVRALSKGETSLNELIDIETYDGQPKTMQNSSAPIRNAEGLIVGAVIVNEDVTERVRAEEALRESAERLQQLSRRLLAVQEEERRHLSRELHDEFGQLLAAVTVQLHAAKGLAGEAARSLLEECSVLLQRAGTQVRSLALELRPAMLDTAGLDSTLRWVAEQHRQRTGVAVEVVGHLNEVSGDVAIACFRMVQEALTNIVRHARAQHIWIELSQAEGTVELVVRDDGVGFNVPKTLAQAAGRGHLGLLGMKERAQILGGSLEVDSEPGRGTRLRISLPVPEATPELVEPVT